ncbi:LysE family translocator [Albimonas pacifica]|uniref:Threonine/homoserine/homoserine lactone efflux protein n=1 Tax=Albimonas pacifica TaxID=1114924 RepID=A0A1I3GRC9_9RHOB|nr:LysE family translocator [Albimonas pacifica]SFI25892.1 Threonine/homoserine/homoserine lactone efflux protein [Albimonas pacifica]
MPFSDLLMIAAIYSATVLSPGPSVMAISATAMASGRRAALALAAGVWCGSVTWCLAAALGMSAVMLANAWMLEVVRYAGAAYLMRLAWISARNAARATPPAARAVDGRDLRRAWRRGLFMHLANPKAILFFGSLFALVVDPAAPPLALAEVALTTATCGAILFPGFALAFSTRRARAVYARLRRWLEGGFAVLFAAAGAALLTGSLSR